MSGQVQFEGEDSIADFKSRTVLGEPRIPKMAQILVDKGIIKSEKSAGNFLLFITILCICLAIFIGLFYGFRWRPFNSVSQEEIDRAYEIFRNPPVGENSQNNI